jgi:hypothetical protein
LGVKEAKIRQKIFMNGFKKMFEEGVTQALKLLQDPRLREGAREALAKSAEVVLQAAKEVAKQDAKGGRSKMPRAGGLKVQHTGIHWFAAGIQKPSTQRV